MTLVELRAIIRLLAVVEATNVTDANILIMINQAIREIAAARRWRWLEKQANISTVANQQDYAVPADFDYAIALVDDDNDNTLEYVSPATFFELFGNDTGNTGTTANIWTTWADATSGATEIWLRPIPSAIDANRYRLYYYKTPTALVADGDIPGFHLGFHWMIVEWVKWKLFEREELFEQSEQSRRYYDKLLEDMERFYSNRTNAHPFLVGDIRLITKDPWLFLPDPI